jgi:putative transposase
MLEKPKPFYRRKLPHWQPGGAAIFITWRLYGSLPDIVIKRLEETRRSISHEMTHLKQLTERKVRHSKQLFAMLDEALDRVETGPLWLRQEPVAEIIVDALLNRYKELYSLWSYVVMANHVHIFLQPKVAQTLVCNAEPSYVPMKFITKRLKGYTAREANRILGRTGQPFWQIESFDHWARKHAEFCRIITYIENNPVRANLAVRAEDWPWSAARERLLRGLTKIRALT